MKKEDLGANLRRLRARRGLTQTAVAKAAGLTRIGYRNIELGIAMPRADRLMEIAKIFNETIENLFSPVKNLAGIRFRAAESVPRSAIIAQVSGWLNDYNQLEEALGDVSQSKINEINTRLSGVSERPEKAAIITRQLMQLPGNEPVQDICSLLCKIGVKLYTPRVQVEGFFGLSVSELDAGPLIVVNTWEKLTVERWIFTAAHELGHLILHLNSYQADRSEENPDEEAEANEFASYFLMPREEFDKQFEEAIANKLTLLKIVFKLKSYFRVSWSSVLYRIGTKYPANRANIWRSFYDEYRAVYGRGIKSVEEPNGMGSDAFSPEPAGKLSEEPGHLHEGIFVFGRLQRLIQKARESDLISIEKAAEILEIEVDKFGQLYMPFENPV